MEKKAEQPNWQHLGVYTNFPKQKLVPLNKEVKLAYVLLEPNDILLGMFFFCSKTQELIYYFLKREIVCKLQKVFCKRVSASCFDLLLITFLTNYGNKYFCAIE